MLKVSLLGVLTIYDDDQLITHEFTAKVQALLCYLMVEARPHERSTLATLLWGEDATEKARNSLRVALASLRKKLPAYFEVTRLTIAFAPSQPYTLDVDDFQWQTRSLDDLEALYQAFLLYRGSFLTDFYVEKAKVFEDWQRTQQEHWQQRFLHLAQTLADYDLAQQAYDKALPILQRILEIEPWQETAHHHLMMAYSRLGDFNAALTQYKRCQTMLRQELDVEPMPETRHLYEQIRIARMTTPYQLPATTPPFFGREAMLQQIHSLLTGSDCRLLTLVGLGGAGKTRLAQAVAHTLSEARVRYFLHGITFVSLVGVETITLLPLEIASALQLELMGQSPPWEQLVRYLAERELLLILDNFEQLREEAAYLDRLLTGCPRLKLLVTSREPLSLSSEQQMDVHGLAYPAEAHLRHWADFAAVRLFRQTVTQLNLDPALVLAEAPAVTQLCHLVSGMPLALKMAAAWLNQMTMPEIVAQVEYDLDMLRTQWRDVPPRQRSIRVVLDHTWVMLPSEAQVVVTALAVFRGGFTLTAAKVVAKANMTLLTALQYRGLLSQNGTERYEMHELVRQYALEQVTATVLDGYRQEHAAYYSQDMQQQTPYFYGAEHQTAVDYLTTENDNQRAAWQWCTQQVEKKNHTSLLLTLLPQMMLGLTNLYAARSLYQLGQQSLTQMVDVMQQAGWATAVPAQQILLAQAQVSLATFHHELGQYEQVETLVQMALPTLTDHQVYHPLALALLTIGRTNVRRGQGEVAQPQLEESLVYARKIQDRYIQAQATNSLAIWATNKGAYDLALSQLKTCLSLYQEEGYVRGTSQSLCNIGTIYARTEDLENGLTYFQQALTLAEAHAYKMAVVVTTSNIGYTYSLTGKFEQAINFYEKSLTIARDVAHQRWIVANLNGMGKTYMEYEQLSAAHSYLQEALTIGYENDMAPDIMSSITSLGHVRARQGYPEDGLRLLLFAQHHPMTIATNQKYMLSLLEELQQELPQPLIAAAQAWAEVTPLAEVVDWIRTGFTVSY